MGTAALVIFLASLGFCLLSLALLVLSFVHLYRTVRYAYKDSQHWRRSFSERASRFNASLRSMEERLRNTAAEGHDMRETVDDMRDFLEEVRSHPLLRAARFASRFRR